MLCKTNKHEWVNELINEIQEAFSESQQYKQIYIVVLVLSDFCNKLPWSGLLINNKKLFLTVWRLEG